MRTLEEIQPGMTLGRYEFLVPIAQGGMAAVWAGRQKGSRGFSKTVAIKTMLPTLSDDDSFEQMFMDEAQIASRIRHANVVEILDLGDENDVLYLVMEYVDGEPLGNLRRAAAKQGGVPRPIGVRIVADACAGLHAAHELSDDQGRPIGLVHRDVSPQNLLVTHDGVVKIVDFGVAKAAGRTSQATTAGQVKGKPPYMAPEQALGSAVDRRADIFALGIILYQLTTGKHPFRGESDLVTLQNIVSDKPVVPPRAYDKTFPRLLDAAIMKALHRDRDLRFQTCAEFEAALDEVFAKELPRARTEDVAKFVAVMFGKKSQERRQALKEALRLADERAERGEHAVQVAPHLRESKAQLATPPSGTGRASITDSDSGSGTPYAATIATLAPEVRHKRSRRLVAFAAVALLGVGLFLATRGPGETPVEDGGPTVAALTPSVAAPTEPPTAATAEVPSAAVPAPPAAAEPASPEPTTVAATGPKRAWQPRSGAAKTKVTSTTPATTTVTKTKTKSTFVPPPVSNPGF